MLVNTYKRRMVLGGILGRLNTPCDARQWAASWLRQTEADPAVVKQGVQFPLQSQEFPDHGALQSSR